MTCRGDDEPRRADAASAEPPTLQRTPTNVAAAGVESRGRAMHHFVKVAAGGYDPRRPASWTGRRAGVAQGAARVLPPRVERLARWQGRPPGRCRYLDLPDDLFEALLVTLPPREDRDLNAPLFPDLTDARVRIAITRACKATGTPRFSPHGYGDGETRCTTSAPVHSRTSPNCSETRSGLRGCPRHRPALRPPGRR